MKISPITTNINVNRYKSVSKNCKPTTSFQGKHNCAKVLGGVAAGLGTAGMVGGSVIMTGGVTLIPVLAYGALCGVIGAIGGHILDKNQLDYDKIPREYDKNNDEYEK